MSAGTCVDAIAQVTRMRPQAIAQFALLTPHVAVGLMVLHREPLQTTPRTNLSDVAGLDDRSFQLPTMFGG